MKPDAFRAKPERVADSLRSGHRAPVGVARADVRPRPLSGTGRYDSPADRRVQARERARQRNRASTSDTPVSGQRLTPTRSDREGRSRDRGSGQKPGTRRWPQERRGAAVCGGQVEETADTNPGTDGGDRRSANAPGMEVARPSIGRHGGSCERSKLVGPGLSRGARKACRRQRLPGMEPGHLHGRRRARSRPEGARTAGTSKQVGAMAETKPLTAYWMHDVIQISEPMTIGKHAWRGSGNL